MSKLKSFALAAFLLGSAASAQTTLDLSLDDARAIATRALFSGDSALALDVARAILTQVPDDRASLLIVAAAAPQQGDAAEGRRAGARAFALSGSNIERYEAARLTALAAANEERFTLATFWLRRALIVAPNDAERAQTRQDAQFLQQRNPWSFDVSASLVPSSNVNGGAASDLASAPGNPTGSLSDDAQALAGWRGSIDLGVTYRLQENPTSRTLIGAQYQMTRIRITDDVDVPDEALATDNLGFNLRHDRVLETGSIGAQLSYAMVDYRDLDSVSLETEVQKFDVWRLGIDRRVPVGENAEVTLSVGRSLTSYELARIGDVVSTSLGASLAYRLPSTDQIRATLSFSDSDGDNPNYISTDWTAQLAYTWAEPVGPIALSVSGGITKADYPEYSLLFPVDGGRQDTTLFYAANIGFPDVSYAGFTPVLTISGSNTDSNVSRFTRDTLSAGFTIRSEF
ncbi:MULTISPECIES: surface lipoprotein assembly modifier [unclassified Yoonia]|uniref:surface lipoprotein assembly modifier n=1 Tax=unclassified Yoonia TaxID=2629118 RepID=UPI002AFFE11F|nr:MULTISPECIES: surface lipoprotein assembly modifier [unclassified Yoonia]